MKIFEGPEIDRSRKWLEGIREEETDILSNKDKLNTTGAKQEVNCQARKKLIAWKRHWHSLTESDSKQWHADFLQMDININQNQLHSRDQIYMQKKIIRMKINQNKAQDQKEKKSP